jgi:hypothetical protein
MEDLVLGVKSNRFESRRDGLYRLSHDKVKSDGSGCQGVLVLRGFEVGRRVAWRMNVLVLLSFPNVRAGEVDMTWPSRPILGVRLIRSQRTDEYKARVRTTDEVIPIP